MINSKVLGILALLTLLCTVSSHQSMSFPTSISFTKTCRVGLGRNCPGPCPNSNLRSDQSPANPAVTVRRGQTLNVKTYKNNHVGGFARWSIVKIQDMNSKIRHHRYAFHYSCADLRLTKCTSQNRGQFCPYDNKNEYYQHPVKIPEVYPDGVYVLGFAWYGGLISSAMHGSLGDYYDCSYIRISGGPTKNYHRPTFNAGPSVTGQRGLCASTVNKLGVCYREPCPGGVRKPQLLKPVEFEGRSPDSITRDRFPGGSSGGSRPPARPKPAPKRAASRHSRTPRRPSGSRAEVTSLKVFNADRPGRVYANSQRGFSFKVGSSEGVNLAVTCDTRGHIKYVSFWVNGRRWRNDWDRPYSMTTDFKVLFGTRISTRYTPWRVRRRKTYRVACEAVGMNGSKQKRLVQVRVG